MSKLIFTKEIIPSSNFNGQSSLPPISVDINLEEMSDKFFLDEDDCLFLKYGEHSTAFPYRYLDMYDRATDGKEYDVAILENEFLKATFLPYLGGKLWSLIDKKTGRELLFRNSIVRPGNLGIRNSYTSGGVEWNCGFRGHHPYTASMVNYGETALDDGTPVLRFFWFERTRCCIVQMDFFLPDDSKFLIMRTRITNPNNKVIPMYWWSNIAVEQKEGDRVIAPADKSYCAVDGEVFKIDIPNHGGIDVTYPLNNVSAFDYFWTTYPERLRYITQVDKNGYGIVETSTARLKGRKLFVWGNSRGGSKWMNFLSKDDETGAYDEIQCGLANTQYECLPMPPHSVWEWAEAYGSVQLDKDKAHGEWHVAQKEAEDTIASLMPPQKLQRILDETRGMSKREAKMVQSVEAWGALEQMRKEKLGDETGIMCPHLKFAEFSKEQEVWIKLLNEGTVGIHDPKDIPESYMAQTEWVDMLKDAITNKDKDNWYAYYLLGTALQSAKENFEAEKALLKSLELEKSAWAHYALAILYEHTKVLDKSKENVLKAAEILKDDISLGKEIMRMLFAAEDSEESVRFYESAADNIKENNRCRLYYAYALARLDKIDESEKILCGEDGKTFLVVPDVRECELTVTQLWVYIHEKRGMTREQMGEPPQDLDFRMFAKREGWF
ncbi:MAG: DUF5107 domain-containing protein [Clostridia bacterium]|nr:DUF5107 domain-containing protein [Clostridia bacterium]